MTVNIQRENTCEENYSVLIKTLLRGAKLNKVVVFAAIVGVTCLPTDLRACYT